MDLEHLDPADWREWRRMRAWHLKQLGWKQRQIAVALGVREGTVSRWLARHAATVPPRCCPHGPRPSRHAEPDQMRLIPDFLWHGAEAYGFRGEVWTCGRVAEVIEEEFGSLLQQEPGVAAAEGVGLDAAESRSHGPSSGTRRRSSAGASRSGPRLKEQARRERRALVFVDESGFYLLPGRGQDLRPRGADTRSPRVADP